MDEETKRQILEELGQYIATYPQKQEDDISPKDIAERYGISERQASIKIKQIAHDNPEKWERVKVKGEINWTWVLRKK